MIRTALRTQTSALATTVRSSSAVASTVLRTYSSKEVVKATQRGPEVLAEHFSECVNRLRGFFLAKGWTEVHTQSRLSIMAACEDPWTLATYNYNGSKWPLPQTGQMWLEHELLRMPEAKGVFCLSTSYREEPNPVEGRHDIIFPMFEFESHGDMGDMLSMEREMLAHLGFGEAASFPEENYEDVAKFYGVKELESEHEARMVDDYGKALLLKNFPTHTSPFWNMKRIDGGDRAAKCDVIVHGQETVGSAERSCDKQDMRYMFETISEGKYAEKLYELFGKERVQGELNEFLEQDFFPRWGGGIGVTRLVRAMQLSNLLGSTYDAQHISVSAGAQQSM